MEAQVTFIHVLLALLGMVIHILIKVNARKKKSEFSLGYWVTDNWLNSVITLLSLIALLFIAPDYVEAIGVKWGNGVAFCIGYMCNSLFKNLTNWYKNKFKAK